MHGDSFKTPAVLSDLSAGLGRAEAKLSVQELVCEAYGEERSVVFAYLRSLGAEPGDAQELTQEVFLSYYLALRRGSDILVRRAWLFTVASRLFLNWNRRQRGLTFISLDGHGTKVLTLANQCGTAEDSLLNEEKLRTIAEAIGTLSPQQQICLHLRAEGLHYREIADVLGVKIPTVSEFVRRGLARLRRILDA